MPGGGGNREDRRNYLQKISAKAGNNDSAVAVPKFCTGNNWLKFKKKISTACLEKYGNLVQIMQTESYYETPKIEGIMMEPYIGWQTNKIKEML